MKRERSDAIILYSIPMRERDKLVTFLTPERGKMKGWAYGARGARNRFGASLEPLARVTVAWIERENDELVRIESVDMERSFFPAQQNLASNVAGSYLAENADIFAQANEPAELLFRLLDRVAEAMLQGLPTGAAVAYFEIWILKLAGIFPSMRYCHSCQIELGLPLKFDADASGFVCPSCQRGKSVVIATTTFEVLQAILTSSVPAFAATAPRRADLFEVRSLARSLRRSFLGHELRSHDLLGSVLAG